MDSPSRSFGTPLRYTIPAIVCTALLIAFAVSIYGHHSIGFRRYQITIYLAAVWMVWLCNKLLINRVILSNSSLAIREPLRRVSYVRADVLRATWEGGAPVHVDIRGVGWVRLPRVGTDGHALASEIDLWIRREPQA